MKIPELQVVWVGQGRNKSVSCLLFRSGLISELKVVIWNIFVFSWPFNCNGCFHSGIFTLFDEEKYFKRQFCNLPNTHNQAGDRIKIWEMEREKSIEKLDISIATNVQSNKMSC